VCQQISTFAAGSILRRIIERFSETIQVGEHALNAFPSAQILLEADVDVLRSLGLSASKVVAIRAAAKAVLSYDID